MLASIKHTVTARLVEMRRVSRTDPIKRVSIGRLDYGGHIVGYPLPWSLRLVRVIEGRKNAAKAACGRESGIRRPYPPCPTRPRHFMRAYFLFGRNGQSKVENDVWTDEVCAIMRIKAVGFLNAEADVITPCKYFTTSSSTYPLPSPLCQFPRLVNRNIRSLNIVESQGRSRQHDYCNRRQTVWTHRLRYDRSDESRQ